MLGVLPALGAEPAADIAGDDPNLALRDFEYTSGERLTHPVRILHVGIQSEPVFAGVPHADRAARFHEMCVNPADHVAALDYVSRLREHRLSPGSIAGLEQVRDVIWALVP